MRQLLMLAERSGLINLCQYTAYRDSTSALIRNLCPCTRQCVITGTDVVVHTFGIHVKAILNFCE